MDEERPKGQEYSDTEPGEPDPQNAGSEEFRARTGGAERGGSHGGDPIADRELSGEERLARDQAEEILRESDARVEDPSTTDPHDDSIERRRSEETAGGSG